MLLSLWLIPSASVGRDSAAQDRKAVKGVYNKKRASKALLSHYMKFSLTVNHCCCFPTVFSIARK
uniref:Secreted protein n=1 Tax=Moschus moschiferus TaxID=68415 RepID=A0A8C6CJU2_MOSMO